MSVTARDLAQQLFARVVAARLRPALHEKQTQFVDATVHHAAFVGGIGSGKSWAGSVRAFRASQGWIGDRQIPVPNLGAITAPTYPMLNDATFRTFMEIAGEFVESFNGSTKVMKMKNGSEILWRTVKDPDALRGPSLSWWFGDEAAQYKASVYPIMIGRLRQFGQQGYDWVTSTPRGRNWLWQKFVRDAEGDDDYLVVTVRSRDNIYLADAILETWENEYTGDFARQELDGQFIDFSGLIYGEFDHRLHVVRQRPQVVRVVAGVDWGYANPGVILVCGVDGDGRLCVLHEEYASKRTDEDWTRVAVQLRDTWRVEAFYCDPSEPDYIKRFKAAGLKAEAAQNQVLAGISAVKNRLVVQGDDRPRLTVWHECRNLIREFEGYEWSENQHGLKDAPVKANDHAMDALRYATMAVDHPTIRKLKAETRRYA